ncbi:MAG: class I SAM-dependent methyltransferase [Thermodesulfobacteriota bacterium]|nr:class I SAM-dependent methyltransferase [Thermodesulfobacteriota bacterium]
MCGRTHEEVFCESADYISGEVFRVVRCSVCGLIYVNPQPSAEELVCYYPQTHQSSAPAAYERSDARPRVKLVSSLFGGTPGRILDIGCGKGLLLAGLRKKGWKVFGTELSEVSAQIAGTAGITVYNLPVEECPFEPESFDVATLYHSLEHMTNPLKTLRAVHGLLRPGGSLVVEVPNIGSWYAKAFGTAWFHLDAPRHLYHFNRHTLRRMLEACGFLVVRESTHNVQYDAFGAVQSVLNRFLHKKNLLNNFNTGEVKLGELWHEDNGVRNLTALAISEVALLIGFPLFALMSLALSRWVDGGTLRFIATRN